MIIIIPLPCLADFCSGRKARAKPVPLAPIFRCVLWSHKVAQSIPPPFSARAMTVRWAQYVPEFGIFCPTAAGFSRNVAKPWCEAMGHTICC